MSKNIRISSLKGNSQKLDGGSMFGNAPKAIWQKWAKPDELGRIDLACRSMLAEIDDTKILFETGIGAFFEPKLAERFGVQEPDRHLLTENLNSLGIQEEEIDYVFLSHLHFDHAGGLMPSYKEQQEGKKDLHFPKAKYLVGEDAWQRAQKPHPRDQASFIPELKDLLIQSERLEVLPEGKWQRFADALEIFVSDGHTPGQYLPLLKGEKRNVVFCGDLIPGRPWMHIPITMGYDRFPEKLIDEKMALYERLKEKNDILFFTHDFEVAGATFYKDEKGKVRAEQEFTNFQNFEI